MTMHKKSERKMLVLCLLPPILVGLLDLILTYKSACILSSTMKYPPLPASLWPVCLSSILLYLLMGAATFRIIMSNAFKDDLHIALMAYTSQLMLYFLWPLLIFRLQLSGLALLILAILCIVVCINIMIYYRICKSAGILLFPYILFLLFITYLNIGVLILN